MRLKRFLCGVLLGSSVLVFGLAAAPASAAEDGYCREYGSFVCCRTETDAVCIEVQPLKPAG